MNSKPRDKILWGIIREDLNGLYNISINLGGQCIQWVKKVNGIRTLFIMNFDTFNGSTLYILCYILGAVCIVMGIAFKII